MKVPALALLLMLAATACRESAERTLPFWVYRNHVAQYEALCADLDKHLAATPDPSCIVGLTDSLIRHIALLEDTLLRIAGQPRLTTLEEPPPMDRLLDPYLASDLLIGDEPARGADHAWSARTLKTHLDRYAQEASRCTGLPLRAVRGLLDTRETHDAHGPLIAWDTRTFYHLPLIQALDELNGLKLCARRLELLGLMNAIRPTDEQ